MRNPHYYLRIYLLLFFATIAGKMIAQENFDRKLVHRIDKEIKQYMEEGDIPGLSVVLIKNGKKEIRNYGFANVELKVPVTENTLFQIGSCSKAFTALAIEKLKAEGKMNGSASVSSYLPWFRVVYKGKSAAITVDQLLHHSSGLPWKSIANIKEDASPDALYKTIRSLIGYELKNKPGSKYEYATINYDVLALIIEKITGDSFETYLQNNIIQELGLKHTTIGVMGQKGVAQGYKISFLSARPYDAPQFRGNNAAGYVISNASDMAEWLAFQMGERKNHLYEMALMTQMGDVSVAIHGSSQYAAGWEVAFDGSGDIYHAGLNPNFTSYVSFRPNEKIGVIILSNSNSNYTPFIGNQIQKILAGDQLRNEIAPDGGLDSTFTLITFIVLFYMLLLFVYSGRFVIQLVKSKRTFEKWNRKKTSSVIFLFLSTLPFFIGVYLLPQAMSGFTWNTIDVWTPGSFFVAFQMLISGILLTQIIHAVGLFFPEKDKYVQMIPSILLVSVLTGLSGILVIMMVTSSFNAVIELKYLVFYYLLILFVYLLGRRFVQKKLIQFTNGLMFDLRIKMIRKILATSYQRFEKLDDERIYTALNDDVMTIGNSTSMFVTLFTSVITVLGAFIYLSSIAFWATMITLLMLVLLTALGFFIIKRTSKYFESARDTRNGFIYLINGLIGGYKEISLQKNKKLQYEHDMSESAREYKEKVSIADLKAFDGSLVGESMLVLLLGAATFGMPEVFPNIELYTIMSFVMVLLYLIGPINGILQSAPQVINVYIAWNRIKSFIKEIPENEKIEKISSFRKNHEVEKLTISDVFFNYENTDEQVKQFGIGPVNLEANRGDIIFIIGGNGSGKTTLAKLLTGLYVPTSGEIRVNGVTMDNYNLGEYYSTVFSPAYLFKKLYNVKTSDREEQISQYLQLLDLEGKVVIENNEFSTLKLSSGQRKRLALLQCYLEDSGVYLFDEWAADQDPEYRKFFYKTLLPEMKKMGKIIIAITHDDHYFDVADKVLKMDNGVLKDCTDQFLKKAYI